MILALDSSTSVLSLAVLDGDRVLAARDVPDGGKHGTALPLEIERVLGEAGASLDQLKGFAVGLGPGSFTGLRVGLATIKGLAYARKLPVGGTSSLRALAVAALRGGRADRLVAALLDARHGELYAGVFRGPHADAVAAELSLPPARLSEALGDLQGAVDLVGEGVFAYEAQLKAMFSGAQLAAAQAAPRYPSAIAVAALSVPLPVFSEQALFQLGPSYVRASEAEIKFPQGLFKPREG
jgi:tRNA threonylcarbamoyladenosine biosynthesis protein TsaB